jgi:glutamate--cysteine ligase
MVSLARHALARRRHLDRSGRDETHFLDALEPLIESGKTSAELLLEKYYKEWNGSVDPVFTELAY